MQIWLDQVREEPLDWEETLTVEPEALGAPELLALSPISCRGRIVYADPSFLLRARLAYEQTLSCMRCLKPIVLPTEAEVELTLLVDGDGSNAAELELEESDIGLLHLDDEVLRTEPMVAEQVQLNIPMKPLCREDCRGLCAVCGTDLNAGACDCAEPAADPRWAALAAIKSRLDET
jgi:uncharacterized protein